MGCSLFAGTLVRGRLGVCLSESENEWFWSEAWALLLEVSWHFRYLFLSKFNDIICVSFVVVHLDPAYAFSLNIPSSRRQHGLIRSMDLPYT